MRQLFGGTVFDANRARNTSGLGIDSYMRAMGHNPFEPVEFEPIEADLENIDDHENAKSSYLNSLERLNSFGMAAAGKGINVLSPNPNNPTSVSAAREFQRMMNDVNNQLAGLKTSHDVKKLLMEERLKDGNFATPVEGRLATMDDLNSVHNIGQYRDDLNDRARALNTVAAKEFDMRESRDANNKELDGMRSNMGNIRPILEKAGIPEDIINSIIQGGQDQVGVATYSGREDLMKSQRAKNYAQANKARGGDRDELAYRRKELIARIQNGDPSAINSLAKLGIDASYDDTGSEAVLVVGDTSIPINDNTGGGFFQINNIINDMMKSKEDRVSVEEMDKIADPDYNAIAAESRAKRRNVSTPDTTVKEYVAVLQDDKSSLNENMIRLAKAKGTYMGQRVTDIRYSDGGWWGSEFIEVTTENGNKVKVDVNDFSVMNEIFGGKKAEESQNARPKPKTLPYDSL
jgi:hypothetical protein